MALRVEHSLQICSEDGKVKWDVEPESTVIVNNEQYVKLARSSKGFARLVFHKCPNVPQPVPKHFSLTASHGYNELMSLRSTVQSANKENAIPDNVPAIFKAIVKKKLDHPKRMSRAQEKDLRNNIEILVVDILGVCCLRPF